MNAKLALVGLGLGLVVAVFKGKALAQSHDPPTAAEIRREIAELKQLLRTAALRLEALERRLEQVEPGGNVPFRGGSGWEREDSYLRFPIETERAMMVPHTYPPSPMNRLNFLAPSTSDEGQGGSSGPGIPGPLDVPKLRP